MSKPNWAERKALRVKVIKHDKRLMQRATKLYLAEKVFSCSDLVHAMQQEKFRERRRAVRAVQRVRTACPADDVDFMRGYLKACDDCIEAISDK